MQKSRNMHKSVSIIEIMERLPAVWESSYIVLREMVQVVA